jgi:5-methylcytosine-specific restriction protein A
MQPQRVSAATIRDHVVPLAEGGRDEETNVQAICMDCHREKTERESQRGKQRAL